MSRIAYTGSFKDLSGNAVSSGDVVVYNANGTTLATVYSSSGASSALSTAKVQSNSVGTFKFWVDTTDYSVMTRFKVELSKADFSTTTYDDISILPSVEIGTTGSTVGSSGTGAIVSFSYTGGYGTTEYTVGDIVNALKRNDILST